MSSCLSSLIRWAAGLASHFRMLRDVFSMRRSRRCSMEVEIAGGAAKRGFGHLRDLGSVMRMQMSLQETSACCMHMHGKLVPCRMYIYKMHYTCKYTYIYIYECQFADPDCSQSAWSCHRDKVFLMDVHICSAPWTLLKAVTVS